MQFCHSNIFGINHTCLRKMPFKKNYRELPWITVDNRDYWNFYRFSGLIWKLFNNFGCRRLWSFWKFYFRNFSVKFLKSENSNHGISKMYFKNSMLNKHKIKLFVFSEKKNALLIFRFVFLSRLIRHEIQQPKKLFGFILTKALNFKP